MEETVKMIANYGVSTIVIALFVWDWITNKRKINETLEQNSKCLNEMRNSNINIAKSLEIIKDNMDTQKVFLIEHDKRCEIIEKSIEEMKREVT